MSGASSLRYRLTSGFTSARGGTHARPPNLPICSRFSRKRWPPGCSPMQAAKLAAGETLFFAGDPGDGCYRVETGPAQGEHDRRVGRRADTRDRRAGRDRRRMSTIDGLTRSASVSAVRDSELTSSAARRSKAFADGHPEVYKHLVALLAARLRDTDGVVAAGSFPPAEGPRGAGAARSRRKRSGRMSARAASSSARRSARATSRQWRASPAKTSAAFSTTGSATSWSAGCRATTAWRTKRSSNATARCSARYSRRIAANAGVMRSSMPRAHQITKRAASPHAVA